MKDSFIGEKRLMIVNKNNNKLSILIFWQLYSKKWGYLGYQL